MLFNSFVFVLFLAIVLPVYYALSHRWQNRFLLVASYVFYGYWDWRFLGLLAISTVLDFALALLIAGTDSPRRKKRRVALSVVVNLGILGFFKYFDFFVDSAAVLLESAGLQANLPMLRVVLPVGISFYTFQSMAYTIDVYRGIQPPTRNLLDFALYVAYFPQLVAGPIERASRLLPQIQSPRRVGQAQWERGAQLILWGYVKKVAIADGLAPYADAVFRDPSSFSGLSLWLGVYCFAVQIYCDFSGYTDIARGVSQLLGIELMENFRQPYLSRNITEFWRRWHISLSTWLRDYLYVPLGGNRRGPAMQYRNLMITMLLGGLWHGAAWTFVVWGGLHGLFLATHKYMTRGRKIGQEAPARDGAGMARFCGQGAGDLPSRLPGLGVLPRAGHRCGVGLPWRDAGGDARAGRDAAAATGDRHRADHLWRGDPAAGLGVLAAEPGAAAVVAVAVVGPGPRLCGGAVDGRVCEGVHG
jgi:alginate O-acetyltransferase complex protein AlgI